jgi:hypothetical protein
VQTTGNRQTTFTTRKDLTMSQLSRSLKTAFACAAFIGAAGTAVAQGTPPNPNVANPAIGAGQQSPTGTPKGETGTPTGSGATTARPAAAPTAAPAPAAAPAPMAAPAPAPMTDTATPRRARADRG